ncbi:hypothetical protein HF203_06715 [Marichromatium bheemlicum]|uniref:Uncharacterized protein n=2 Tax=Marichromatium bheemlicum TaxID=365339 RepID=A0ABX1I9P4_9GAMM|nr:hypothetical protein [Marichromatium bheemlicum]NKN32910.1 hypothetical protein [Marichromatium bheemlicum]
MFTRRSARAVALLALLAQVPTVAAFNFGDMMNPGRWMGGDRYDDYNDGPYGPYAPPYGPYGGYGPGYGVPYGGYGMPYAPAPHYPGVQGQPAPALGAPAATADEIEALKRRIEELEARQRGGPQQPQAQPPGEWQQGPAPGEWPQSPAFRPMNQY